MKLGILAGEPSGDLLGAGLIKALRELVPDLTVTGIGGPHMQNEGCQSLFEMERLSLMGLIEPLRHLPDLFKIRRELFKHFSQNKPDIFIGIDSPDFNLGLELKLRQLGIPIVHYVSPSVWAWRQKRIFKIKKAVDMMLTLFPFEADFYQRHGVPVTFVGHPLADQIPLSHSRENNNRLKPYTIAILPGSRRNELKYLADTFIQTAKLCHKQRPDIQFITSAANEQRSQEFQQRCQALAPDLPIQFFVGRSHDVMAAADVVLVTSGTATLETMLFKKPMVIAYKMSGLTYQLARHLVKIPFAGLPNLLANELLVPEFIQADASPEKLSAALLNFVDHPEKIKQIEERFSQIHQQLRRDASQQAAEAVMSLHRHRHSE